MAAESTDLIPRSAQRIVTLLDDQIIAVRLADGSMYVALRALCEALGLDRVGQVRRIRRDETLAEDLRDLTIETEGGPQTVQMLRVDSVPFWLSGVTVKQVKAEIREKIRAYKRWVVQKVYEAFLAEYSLGLDDTALVISPETAAEIADLEKQQQLYEALARMAREQIELKLRTEEAHQRLNKAGQLVKHLDQRVIRLEERLDPANVLTDEQASAVKGAVAMVANLLAEADGKSHYAAVWTELHIRFQAPDYKHIKQRYFQEAMDFLARWHSATLAGRGKGGIPTPPPEA